MILSPADECIYCGANVPALTDEHIVPLALNGTVILPRASCSTCQNSINSKFEGSLSGVTFKPFRELHGYSSRSKKKGRKRRSEDVLVWPVEIIRNIPPFQSVVHEALADVPIPRAQFNLSVPPFLRLRRSHSPVNRAGPYTGLSSNLDHERSRLYEKLLAKRRIPGAKLSLRVPTPLVTIETFERLINKIACGFFFDACRDSYRASGVGPAAVAPRFDEFKEQRRTFSVPRKLWRRSEAPIAEVFGVCEEGRVFLYCCISFLKEMVPNVYFVRIPSLENRTGLIAQYCIENDRPIYLRA